MLHHYAPQAGPSSEGGSSRSPSVVTMLDAPQSMLAREASIAQAEHQKKRTRWLEGAPPLTKREHHGKNTQTLLTGKGFGTLGYCQEVRTDQRMIGTTTVTQGDRQVGLEKSSLISRANNVKMTFFKRQDPPQIRSVTAPGRDTRRAAACQLQVKKSADGSIQGRLRALSLEQTHPKEETTVVSPDVGSASSRGSSKRESHQLVQPSTSSIVVRRQTSPFQCPPNPFTK